MILKHVLEFGVSNVEMEFCDGTGKVNVFTSSINLTFMFILYLHRALNKVTQSANQHMHTFNFFYLLKLI